MNLHATKPSRSGEASRPTVPSRVWTPLDRPEYFKRPEQNWAQVTDMIEGVMILDAFTHRCHAEVVKWAATQIVCYNVWLANILEGNPVPGASQACFFARKTEYIPR